MVRIDAIVGSSVVVFITVDPTSEAGAGDMLAPDRCHSSVAACLPHSCVLCSLASDGWFLRLRSSHSPLPLLSKILAMHRRSVSFTAPAGSAFFLPSDMASIETVHAVVPLGNDSPRLLVCCSFSLCLFLLAAHHPRLVAIWI